jgi:glycosyltransferase involved in cell wall biosynthesis
VQAAPTLLLVTHVAIRTGANGFQIDDQTAAGIGQWCRHFDRVTYVGVAEETNQGAGSSASWVDIGNGGDGLEVLALPRAYQIGSMMRHYRSVRATLRTAIARHNHLCFTIGGLVGDWPALGAVESIRQKRNYSAWIDRVEPTIIRNRLKGASVPKRAAATIALPAMEQYTRYLLRNSKVALLQGLDTFDHYRDSCADPHCTYDTHTQPADQIGADELAGKQARVQAGSPLAISYVGRADGMKGTDDWIGVLEILQQRNVPFEATWMGDGPDLANMKARLSRAGLADAVHLAGFVSDRERILRSLRESDLLLFCHKTAESARCLIEALVCGTPLVGYESAYLRGLVDKHGGAAPVPRHDVAALADRVEELHRDRPKLARLIGAAAESGRLYNEDLVYAHRAGLMKRASMPSPRTDKQAEQGSPL